MEKLLFFDIDGTLAIPGHAPSPATTDAIRKARLCGHKVFLSTGRTIGSVPGAVMDIGFDGGIFSAGGYVMAEGKVLSNHFMSEELVQSILGRLPADSVFYVLETADGKFRSDNAKTILEQVDFARSGSHMQRLAQEVFFGSEQQEFSLYRNQPVYKISFFSSDFSCADHLNEALNGIAKVVRFDDLVPGFPLVAGEISDFSINKGIALRDACRHYGKTPADCIAFGDSMNDAEILLAAGLGIAMGNAEARVKQIADMVCESCENDGVAVALHRLGLIP